jgi:hypothetical protein
MRNYDEWCAPDVLTKNTGVSIRLVRDVTIVVPYGFSIQPSGSDWQLLVAPIPLDRQIEWWKNVNGAGYELITTTANGVTSYITGNEGVTTAYKCRMRKGLLVSEFTSEEIP